MRFIRYRNQDVFRADVMPTLLEAEAQNNLPIGILSASNGLNTDDWLMGMVVGNTGQTMLIALCTKPFNMLLYAPKRVEEHIADKALSVLAGELKRMDFKIPGIFTDSSLALRFASCYPASVTGKKSMTLMELDELAPFEKAPGSYRHLTENDLSFVPLWEQEFCVDCRIPSYPLDENTERIRTRIEQKNHYIWEDGLPVSQAVFGRETPNGAVINWVYTPPMFRSRGYATTVVGVLSADLLGRGKKFCCLFADTDNPISRSIYKKLGYYDVCEFLEITFA